MYQKAPSKRASFFCRTALTRSNVKLNSMQDGIAAARASKTKYYFQTQSRYSCLRAFNKNLWTVYFFHLFTKIKTCRRIHIYPYRSQSLTPTNAKGVSRFLASSATQWYFPYDAIRGNGTKCQFYLFLAPRITPYVHRGTPRHIFLCPSMTRYAVLVVFNFKIPGY